MRKDRLKRLFSLFTVGFICFVFSVSTFAEMPIPDFKPDLGTFTPSPEATPYELSPSPTSASSSEPVKGYSSVKVDNDYLTIYAPEGMIFHLLGNRSDGTLDIRFTGKGLNEPALTVPYSEFLNVRCDSSSIVVSDLYGSDCFLSTSSNSITPSIPSNWTYFQDSQDANGCVGLPFVTLCMRLGGVIYVHPTDIGMRPLDGVYPTPTPTPLPDVQDSEGITGIVDFTNVFNSVAFIGTFMRAIYTFFPYLIAIVWLAIVVMIIRLVVS